MVAENWTSCVIEGQQFIAVLDQAFSGLWVYSLKGFDEQVESVLRIYACKCHVAYSWSALNNLYVVGFVGPKMQGLVFFL